MLKKILEDGVCPEEILNNITDEDKQLIFLEIRKEQVRKYKLWQTNEEGSLDFHHKPNKKGKNVGFFDDSQLVSFLGEREGEKPVEEKLLEEALEKAMLEAEIQIEKELEISTKIENTKIETVSQIESVPTATNITKEIATKKEPPEVPIKHRGNKTPEQKRLEMVRRKSTELYQTYINQISELEETAKKENEELTKFWKMSEEQAKSDEEQRRKLAEEARKLHAHINSEPVESSKAPENNTKKVPIPNKKSEHLKIFMNNLQKSNLAKSMSEIKSWFLDHEWNKLRIVDGSTDTVPDWFHGIISREESEALLEKKKRGTFLIRLSDKFQCYVLSYKAKQKIKHILIESKVDSQVYTFFGPANTRSFKSLAELILFFQTRPLSDSNCDILTDPCGQKPGQISDYMSLLHPDCNSSTC